MSQMQASPYETLDYSAVLPTNTDIVEPSQLSSIQPILLVLPVIICGISYLAGGIPVLTDLGFICLTVLCAIFLVQELLVFSERFGVAGIVVYGGILIWICYDYMSHWAFAWFNVWRLSETQVVVAKASAVNMVYFWGLAVGIRFRFGKWISKIMLKLPEPKNPGTYFWVMVLTQIIGISPYFWATAEPFYMAIYHAMIAGRSGANAVAWAFGRSGNVNYQFGGYIAQILQVGSGGAMLASFCIIYLRQTTIRNIICALCFMFWAAVAFGGGTRGDVVMLFLPAVVFLFIRYHVEAQEHLKKFSAKAYAVAAGIFFVLLVVVQTQIAFRTVGFSSLELNDVSLTNIQGNAMFSEGLMAFRYIPELHPYFCNTFPGENVIRPIPDFFWWMAISPLPRAIWNTKPIDPVWAWYNDIVTGGSGEGEGKIEGTTVAQGVAGYWFIRYGVFGVLEGGLLTGWILSISEMALLNNRNRPTAVFCALGFCTWIFRDFRGVAFGDLNQFLVGLIGIAVCILLIRPFVDGSPQVEAA